MSAIATTPQADELPCPEDPFRYGWREVQRIGPDGRVHFDRLPLTYDNLLHPQFGDVVSQSVPHERDRMYLRNVSQLRLIRQPGALVASDLQIIWDDPDLRAHSPDLSIFFGVTAPERERKSFDVAEEGVRPAMLIEIVSPGYRINDVETKVHEYHQARVPSYLIVDREADEGPVRLLGYQYRPRRYLPMPLEDGRLWLEPIGVWLGTRDNRVVCFDGITEKEIGDYAEVCDQLTAETARADVEKARADVVTRARMELETRVRELEEKLKRYDSHRTNGNQPGTAP